jgi:hypothetical protein
MLRDESLQRRLPVITRFRIDDRDKLSAMRSEGESYSDGIPARPVEAWSNFVCQDAEFWPTTANKKGIVCNPRRRCHCFAKRLCVRTLPRRRSPSAAGQRLHPHFRAAHNLSRRSRAVSRTEALSDVLEESREVLRPERELRRLSSLAAAETQGIKGPCGEPNFGRLEVRRQTRIRVAANNAKSLVLVPLPPEVFQL